MSVHGTYLLQRKVSKFLLNYNVEAHDFYEKTGAGTAMSRLGMADLGIATLNDMRENAAMIASLDRNIPLIADADTGFGGKMSKTLCYILRVLMFTGPLMVGRTVEQYMQAGVAALHLEDQVVNKRCGHLKNKEIVDEESFVSRIRAASIKRAKLPGDIVIIARTDSLQSLGYDAAVSRLKAAVAVGADVAFLEGITSKDEGKRVCAELAPTPVLLNMVGGGITPNITVAEARDMGFKIIIFPGFALSAVYQSVAAAAKELRETGNIQAVKGPAANPKAIFEICGLKEAIEFDVAAGGKLYTGGV